MPTDKEILRFVTESNRIEGIIRNPKRKEIDVFKQFLQLQFITVADLENFVKAYQPDARLRDAVGLNVKVSRETPYLPPAGCPELRDWLSRILRDDEMSAFERHVAYEKLHPFTDGNGRSGRALWAWEMKDISLGFLHKFYYQTLRYHS